MSLFNGAFTLWQIAKKFWQDVVLEPTGVVPGTYDRPSFTIDENGIITNISRSVTPSYTVVPTILDLPGIPSPATGDLANALNFRIIPPTIRRWT